MSEREAIAAEAADNQRSRSVSELATEVVGELAASTLVEGASDVLGSLDKSASDALGEALADADILDLFS